MPVDLQWTALEWPGLEHVVASADADGFRADSQLIARPPPRPPRVSYQLECDASWRFTGLTITVIGAAGSRTLDLTAGQDGCWLADGQPRRDLDGCTDVDISLTPLTNTLPIRRLGWSAGAAHDLAAVYVTVPELSVRLVRQRYTLLSREKQPKQALYHRYESGSFRADITVDGDGFVTDYPGIWRRVDPGAGAAA